MKGRFSHPLRVRYAECDAQGVVFNSNYLAWLDIAVTELWRVAVEGSYQGMLDRGIDMVVAEARLRYHAPARFDDVVTLETDITRLGNTGMTTAVRVVRDDALLCDSEIRHVFVEIGGPKAPIPEWLRAGLEPYVAAPAEPA